ncbi:MAG: hypothetical protein WBV69_04015 [Candidatus Sulfotelmatobacter sp.]
MNASAHILPRPEIMEAPAQQAESRPIAVRETNGWNPQDFAREQIRGLVWRVFVAGGARPVKRVVFTGAEPNLDVGPICEQVARILALETRAHVALVECSQTIVEAPQICVASKPKASIKSRSTAMTANLWRVPGTVCEPVDEVMTALDWISRLADLSNEFEYLLIHGQAAGISSEAALLGRLTDGVILVLGAHSTRKATARKIKEGLKSAQCRILGTVLSERTFPIPDGIYRRL